jgi:hypothetical protein
MSTTTYCCTADKSADNCRPGQSKRSSPSKQGNLDTRSFLRLILGDNDSSLFFEGILIRG